ncbi:glutamate--ammonia ligase, partial [Oleoguttula sp. CCFEE 5521]
MHNRDTRHPRVKGGCELTSHIRVELAPNSAASQIRRRTSSKYITRDKPTLLFNSTPQTHTAYNLTSKLTKFDRLTFRGHNPRHHRELDPQSSVAESAKMAENPYLSNTANLQKYLQLPQKGAVIAEYVWIDANGGTRSKCKTLKKLPESIKDLSEWNFDGSSTGQAPGDNSDVYLRPVAMYPDPFRLGDNILVMCETWMSDGKPNAYNYRHDAASLMDKYAKHEFWFGLEQEYTLLDSQGWPYGWPKNGFPAPQGPYYCGNGTGKVFCRDLVEAHYKACLYAGIEISGTNAEVMPAQWEYQV